MEEEIKDLDTTEIEEVDVSQLTDEQLKQKQDELKKGAGKKAGVGAKKTESEAVPKEEQKPTTDKVEVTPEEIAKLRKQIQDKEAFIQRQAREIGELRKKVRPETEEEREARLERQRQRFQEDPEAATAEILESLEAKKMSRRDIIRSMIPNIEEIKHDIAELVRQEGVESPENIEIFLNDPYTADPTKLRYWAAEVARNKERAALEERIAELEKRIRGGEKEIVKKIEKAATESKTLTAKDGKEVEAGDDFQLTEEQVPYLTDEELRDALKKIRKR